MTIILLPIIPSPSSQWNLPLDPMHLFLSSVGVLLFLNSALPIISNSLVLIICLLYAEDVICTSYSSSICIMKHEN